METTANNSPSTLNFSFEIDQKQNLMIVDCSGLLDKANSLSLIDKVKQAQNRDENYKRLYDLSNVNLEVSVREFEAILSKAQELLQGPSLTNKVAFVSPDPFVFELLSVYKTFSARYAFHDLEYFRNRYAALQWLTGKSSRNK